MRTILVYLFSVAVLVMLSAPARAADDQALLDDDALLLEDVPDEPVTTNTVNQADVGADFMKALVEMMALETAPEPEVKPGNAFEEVIEMGDDPAKDVIADEPEEEEPEEEAVENVDPEENPLEKGLEKMVEAMLLEAGKGITAALSEPRIDDTEADEEAEELFDLEDLPKDEEVIEK